MFKRACGRGRLRARYHQSFELRSELGAALCARACWTVKVQAVDVLGWPHELKVMMADAVGARSRAALRSLHRPRIRHGFAASHDYDGSSGFRLQVAHSIC